jgi:hypothetical protein
VEMPPALEKIVSAIKPGARTYKIFDSMGFFNFLLQGLISLSGRAQYGLFLRIKLSPLVLTWTTALCRVRLELNWF